MLGVHLQATSTPIKQPFSVEIHLPGIHSTFSVQLEQQLRQSPTPHTSHRKNSTDSGRRSQPFPIRTRRNAILIHSPSLQSIAQSPNISTQSLDQSNLSVADSLNLEHNSEHEISLVDERVRLEHTFHHRPDSGTLSDIELPGPGRLPNSSVSLDRSFESVDSAESASSFSRNKHSRRTFPLCRHRSDSKMSSERGSCTEMKRFTCIAIWDHVTCSSDELQFMSDDVITVVDASDRDWWKGRLGDKEGWFPTAFGQEGGESIEMAGTVEHLRKRALAVRELLYTERHYVTLLSDLIKYYMEPFKKSRSVKASESCTLFSNILELHEFHSKLLIRMELCCVEPRRMESSFHAWKVSKLFTDTREIVELYSTYCNNHQSALATLHDLRARRQAAILIEKCRKKHGTNLMLDSFLLSPIQKICRYQLHLTELLKYTPESHEDYTGLQVSLCNMKQAVSLINDRRRSVEPSSSIAPYPSFDPTCHRLSQEKTNGSGRVTRECAKRRKQLLRFLSNPSI